MTNTKAPYNISVPTATLALTSFTPDGITLLDSHTKRLLSNRDDLIRQLQSGSIKSIGKILGGNHANFILVQILDREGEVSNTRAKEVYKKLAEELGVVVRFRGMEKGCEGCLRVTVGSEEECGVLLQRMKEILNE
jgi:histidinol-phosphate aminotransferase